MIIKWNKASTQIYLKITTFFITLIGLLSHRLHLSQIFKMINSKFASNTNFAYCHIKMGEGWLTSERDGGPIWNAFPDRRAESMPQSVARKYKRDLNHVTEWNRAATETNERLKLNLIKWNILKNLIKFKFDKSNILKNQSYVTIHPPLKINIWNIFTKIL